MNFESLNKAISRCRLCPGLNIPKETMSAPGAGKHKATFFAIGQSLHSYNPETDPQIPFIGTRDNNDSGMILYEALDRANITLEKNLFITNVIHCHPPRNRKSLPQEIRNCTPFLKKELSLVNPKVIIALGRDAREWFKLPMMPHTARSLSFVYVQQPKGSPYYFVVSVHPSYIMRYGSLKMRDQYIRELITSIEVVKNWL